MSSAAEGCGGNTADHALSATVGGIAESPARERDRVTCRSVEAGASMAQGNRVTVVIPLYNKAPYVGRCLESVRRQTCRAFSIIVVDDGSTDGSAEAARPYLGPDDRLVQQANAGAAAARNTGVALAETELVAFLDADDEWFPEFLDLVLGLHDRFPEAGAYGTAYRIRDRRGRLRTRLTFRRLPTSPDGGLISSYLRAVVDGRTPLWSSSVMAHKAALDAVGGFPVGIRHGEDLDTWLRLGLRYPIAWTRQPGAIYRQDADGRVCVEPRSGDCPFADRVEEYARLAAGDPETVELLAEYLAKQRLEMIGRNWRAGDMGRVRELLRACQGTKRFLLWRWAWLVKWAVCAGRLRSPMG